MGLLDPVKKWLWTVAIKKAIKRAAQIAVAFAAANELEKYGYTGGEKEVTAALYAAIEVARNFLKTKWPDKFGWL